eukprot:11969229-Ditylum_brightwellii.AAC.1
MKTEDNQQSQAQVLKREAIEQDIQADPVQISSVVGEDTAVGTIDRRSYRHIVTSSHRQQKVLQMQRGRETMKF